ncbi:MAG TPA: IS4 family transposase [Thermoguttaceae bacterium]|nr:IS4 family transposase [Thermoguttaceae bacterium]
MLIITDVIRQFKRQWTEELSPPAIERTCREEGMTWNDSLLNPVVTIQLFFLQILHGNTACEHLSHLAGMSFSGAAYCKARMRVKLAVFHALLNRCVTELQQNTLDTGRWLGHRVFHVDGSSFSMSDTPSLQACFGQPGAQKPGCGFPSAHWLVMTHAGTGMITKMLTAPLRTHDMSKTVELHPELKAGDLLVADRGFCSYAHLALLLQRGVHGLLRVHQRTIVDFTPGRPHVEPRRGKSDHKKGQPRSRWIKRLGATDQIVAWLKPTERPRWMSRDQFAALPDSIEVRELRYTIHEKGFRPTSITLVTTLLDAERYSLSSLAEQFRQRWEIETNFGHLKTTMKMDVLKCKTVEGVLRELQVFALIYNLVRQVMLEAADRQEVDVRRISFIDALRWLQSARPGDALPKLVVNPYRPNRLEPRVRKRRPKGYPLMNKPRKQLKQELAST